MKTTGAAGVSAALPFSGTGSAASTDDAIDDSFDLSTTGLKEALVVFESNEQVDRLRHLDLESGYHRFEVLPIGYTELTTDQIRTVADWAEVRYVQKNVELEYHNDDARSTTDADAVHADLGYTGSGAHSVVIDSGVDGDHPDLKDDLVGNWRYVNPLSSTEDTMWEEVGSLDTDDNGHGTHCSGSITGSGEKSDGQYKGLAPDADLTVYSAGLTLLIVKPVAAYDHLLSRVRAGEIDVQVVSNSYGASGGPDFNPDDAMNVATWHAFNEGILPLFSAGNSGPGTNTLNPYATAPHVLGVAATDDQKKVTDFSSRGRSPSYDGPTNYKRKKALDNLYEYHAADKTETQVDSGSYSGTVDATASAYHEWDAPSKAGYVEATLSWTPSAEDIDFYLHEGSRDGPVVASSASLNNPEELAGQIEGGKTYYFEVRPFASVAADYAVEFTAYEGITRDVTPLGVYRNGVGATGKLVMSTLAPSDPLQSYAATDGDADDVDTEDYYGRISGTSMSCPVTAGAATLLVDAYYQNHEEYPDPIDVLNTVEATAKDYHDSYTVESMGAGFVDAYDAVRRAESGDWASFGEVKLVDD
ncbi:S8 family serine peptidase [Halorussus limi]|uniref:S8 family serine peptidase n=1 Tax=Halorussus limi TaxID=2938695 RepID=A0A8U0HZ28_9EURY|nr:S8 family serine peptidase [Halorussus limi]UPV76139.1 S8 family serine peptidase [Halorussus limi]